MRTLNWVGWTAGMLAAGVLWAAEGPAACSGDAYHALNFWLGDWQVSDASGHAMGQSKVEAGLDGCEVTETWGAGGFHGRNVHAYSGEDRHWHQLNLDNHGHVHTFEGTAGEHGLEYSGVSKNDAGADVMNRMEIMNLGGDRVKVWWRKSADSGKTWTTAYEAIYSRTDRAK
ncbi:MAG: hypothetical protein ACLP59_31425 [Bryobacteraceae bacterium]